MKKKVKLILVSYEPEQLYSGLLIYNNVRNELVIVREDFIEEWTTLKNESNSKSLNDWNFVKPQIISLNEPAEVLATSEQIGWIFVKGQVHHDHAKPYGENTLEEMHHETLKEIISKNGDCRIEVEEKWKRISGPIVKGKLMSYGKKWLAPILNDGKVIIYI